MPDASEFPQRHPAGKRDTIYTVSNVSIPDISEIKVLVYYKFLVNLLLCIEQEINRISNKNPIVIVYR